MKYRLFSLVCFSIAITIVVGCSTYPDEMEAVKNRLSTSGSDGVRYNIYEAKGRNKLLALQEMGRLAQLRGNYAESAKSYADAIAMHDAIEDKALVSVGDALDSTLAVSYGSDVSMEYPIVGYEKMMLYVLDGFNRLAMGDHNGFGVDMRNLERCRGLVKARIKRELDALEKKDPYLKYRQTVQMEETDGLSDSSVDNAYAMLLLAIWREHQGDMREALAHYEDIQRVAPGNKTVAIGIENCKRNETAGRRDTGEVVVFMEEGFAPVKSIKRGRPEGSSLYMTIPDYTDANCLPYEEGDSLVICEGTNVVGVSSILVDLGTLARKAHKERLRGIVARKNLTAGIKTTIIEINNGINSCISFNPIGEALLLIGGTFTAITANLAALTDEQPDLRSWLLLPRQVQVARFSLPAGKHDLKLYTHEAKASIPVDVCVGGKTIVYCTTLPNGMKCFSRSLDVKE